MGSKQLQPLIELSLEFSRESLVLFLKLRQVLHGPGRLLFKIGKKIIDVRKELTHVVAL